MDSLNLTMRTGSMDYYDTVFCVGNIKRKRLKRLRKAYGLSKKTLVKWGYMLHDEMQADYEKTAVLVHDKKRILIAPS